MFVGLHVKYPLVLSDYDETLIFLTYFFKNTRISNFRMIQGVPYVDTRHVRGNSCFLQLFDCA